MPRVLGMEAVHQLYPDLVKLLDDNSDVVRNAACEAIKQFLSCAPIKNYQGTAIEYMVENLFIHMDDPDKTFQRKVYEVILNAIPVNSEVVNRNAIASLSSQHSSEFCKMLRNQSS